MKNTLFIILALIAGTLTPIVFLGCSRQLSCEEQGMHEISWFIKNWNNEVSNFTMGTWTLPIWQEPEYGNEQSFSHSLDGPSLYLILNSKGRCLTSIEVKAKRDVSIGMASLVSWVKLFKVLASDLSNDERKHALDKLGINKPTLQGGGEVTVASYRFTFSETLDGNILHAEPLKRNK